MLPRAFRQRLGKVCWLDITIIGMLDRADDAVHIGKRPNILDLIRRQDIYINANGAGNARIIKIFIHAVLGRR